MNCPYCNTENNGNIYVEKIGYPSTDLFFETRHHLRHCQSCDLVFAAPITPALQVGLRRYYEEFYNSHDRGWDTDARVRKIWGPSPLLLLRSFLGKSLRVLRELTSGKSSLASSDRATQALGILKAHKVATVLDIGCAYGENIKIFRGSLLNAFGIEPDHQVVSALWASGCNYVDQGFFPMSKGRLSQYDAITMFVTLMYMEMSLELFIATKNILSKTGLIVIFDQDGSQKNNPEALSSLRSPLTLNFKSEKFMRRVASDCGFLYQKQQFISDPRFCFHILLKNE